MNEVVVDRGPSPYITNLEVFCNGRLITTVQADGKELLYCNVEVISIMESLPCNYPT